MFAFNYTLIGGLAVGVWGHVRATKDIDILINIQKEKINDLALALNNIGYKCEVRYGDLGNDSGTLIRLTIPESKGGEIKADILIASRKWEDAIINSSKKVRFEGEVIPVVAPEDLILMKLRAGGAVDLWDVTELLKVLKDSLDIEHLKERARDLRVDKKLNRVIEKIGPKLSGS